MPNQPAAALPLRPGDRAELERWVRSSPVGAGRGRRAQLVLLAAEGVPNREIAARVGVSRPTVNLWRSRYAEGGLAALADRNRPGRPGRRESPHRTEQAQDSAPALLLTKLTVPPGRRAVVPRPKLHDRISEGARRKLTVVSAPAGFGKSTVLSTWVAGSTRSGPPVGWLSLDDRDNDPAWFWRYFVEALSRICPGLPMTASPLLGLQQAPPIATMLTALINDLHGQSTDVVIVLDDYHLIESDVIHRAMRFLLDNLPPRLHLIIATRADPPLPLARLRARGELSEVRAADLRFSPGEAEWYLQGVMGLRLPAADLAELVRRTEGWVGGLQMAALAMRDPAHPGFIVGFTGSNRHVMDYLAEEVLERQPRALRDFLLATSVLDRMCASLCEALTSRRDSQAVLEGLEHGNLFVDPLDDERRWYRYHRLFADVLHQRLRHENPDMVAELQRKAGAWYESQGLPQEAIRYAIRSHDVDRAARLISSAGMTAVLDQQIETLLGWLDGLPARVVRDSPSLGTLRALALVLSNRPDAAEASLRDAERCLPTDPVTDEARSALGRVAVIRAAISRYSGDIERGVALGRRALELLPETAATSRERASGRAHVALAYEVSGDVRAGNESALEEAVAAFSTDGALMPLLNSITRLGRFRTLQGRLRAACATYDSAADAMSQRGGPADAVNNCAYHVGLGEIHLERNDLASAERHLTRAVAMVDGDLMVDAHVVTRAHLGLARLQDARGHQDQAHATLEQFTHLARRRAFFPLLVERGEAARATLSLLHHRLAEAVRWARTREGDAVEPSFALEEQHLALARTHIAQGRDPVTLLDRLLLAAERAGRTDSVIKIMVLRAMALRARDDTEAAVASLDRPLALAEPEGYVRVFVDEGKPMTDLLSQWLTSRSAASGDRRPTSLRYARRLIVDPHRPPPLGEALTPRELEVLELIAAGLSNREIGARLFVATSTVKSYTTSIFRRLGVGSRTQAVATARTRRLITG